MLRNVLHNGTQRLHFLSLFVCLSASQRSSLKEKSTPGTSALWQKSRIRRRLTPCSDTCIKGHRSSACKHTDRPLFEIQKKGRPVTQCSHCRELRKTKQVHIKCNCGDVRPGKGELGQGKSPRAVCSPPLQSRIRSSQENAGSRVSKRSPRDPHRHRHPEFRTRF